MHDVFAGPPTGGRWPRATNRAGGIEGGISNGETILVRRPQPIPTLAHPLPSLDLLTGQPVQAHYERSDVCVVPAAGVVGEAMVCLALADALLDKCGGDTLDDVRANLAAYRARIERAPEAPVAGGRRPAKGRCRGSGHR